MGTEQYDTIKLLTDCIKKKRYVTNLEHNSSKYIDLTDLSFNINQFHKQRIIFEKLDLGDIDVVMRPEFLMFYNSGESAIVEVILDKNNLKNFKDKYINEHKYSYILLGSYKFVLCSEEMKEKVLETIPNNWGILKIGIVKNKTRPYLILERIALKSEKNINIETAFLIKRLCMANTKLSKINQISNIWS